MPIKKTKSRKQAKNLKPSKNVKDTARYIANVIRSSMETFHVKNLSDAQMKELNPIIRNAICTALYASEIAHENFGAAVPCAL